jgi:cell division protein FtsI/penicillin-binding protein 2
MAEVIYSKEPKRKSTKLTRKQALFVKELKKDPKITPTEAARRSYGVSDQAAGTIGYMNMRNEKYFHTYLNLMT